MIAFSRASQWVVQDLGRCDYGAATALMLEMVEKAAGGAADRLLLCEFEPVVTVGRGEDPEHYRAVGLPVHAISRGGKATYHGPGQLVAYPILRLEEGARDLHAYLHALEEALILAVGEFGLAGVRDPRNTGCWVGGRKIASIGVAVRKWVSYHGVALNVSTDLSWFRRFDPCGLDAGVMTSMAAELGQAPPMEQVKEALGRRMGEVLRG